MHSLEEVAAAVSVKHNRVRYVVMGDCVYRVWCGGDKLVVNEKLVAKVKAKAETQRRVVRQPNQGE